MQSETSVLENIANNYDLMFTAEKKVADYIRSNPESAVDTNVSELAELSDTSEATVIRMCKRIGFDGYYQMKIQLSRDLGKNRLVQLAKGVRKPENVDEIFEVIATNLLSLAKFDYQDLVFKSVELIKKSKYVYIIATGNTVPLAMDLSFRLGNLGIRTFCSELSEYYLGSISNATSDDLVIGITHSGSSRHVTQGLRLAKEQNIKTIVITGFKNSPAAKLADCLLCTPVQNSIFTEFEDNNFSITSHIYEFAMIDIILYYVAHGIGENETDKRENVEMLLSDSKL